MSISEPCIFPRRMNALEFYALGMHITRNTGAKVRYQEQHAKGIEIDGNYITAGAEIPIPVRGCFELMGESLDFEATRENGCVTGLHFSYASSNVNGMRQTLFDALTAVHEQVKTYFSPEHFKKTEKDSQ